MKLIALLIVLIIFTSVTYIIIRLKPEAKEIDTITSIYEFYLVSGRGEKEKFLSLVPSIRYPTSMEIGETGKIEITFKVEEYRGNHDSRAHHIFLGYHWATTNISLSSAGFDISPEDKQKIFNPAFLPDGIQRYPDDPSMWTDVPWKIDLDEIYLVWTVRPKENASGIQILTLDISDFFKVLRGGRGFRGLAIVDPGFTHSGRTTFGIDIRNKNWLTPGINSLIFSIWSVLCFILMHPLVIKGLEKIFKQHTATS